MSNQSNVAIPLTNKSRKLVIAACCLLMLFIASSGASIAVLMTPILGRIDALNHFGLVVILGTIGVAVMTPIGGKLGEIFGFKNLILISGCISIISLLALGFVKSITLFAAFRLILSISQGAFTAAPYILVSLVDERKNVPKYMGFLASSVALGTFVGPVVSGLLEDRGLYTISVSFSFIFLLVALLIIARHLPNVALNKDAAIDKKGVVMLSIVITAFVLTLNYAPTLGWAHHYILLGVAIFIISLLTFIKVEKNYENLGGAPIIPMRLFANKEFVTLLFIAITCYYYQSPMLAYGSLAGFKVLGQSATMVGLLPVPRTLVTLLLPSFIGIWLGKSSLNRWKAMAAATLIVGIVFLPLININPNLPIWVLFVSFGLTGIAESFRSVSVTPSVQESLDPADIAAGTALATFAGSLTSLLSSTVSAFVINAYPDNVALGLSRVFQIVVVVSFVGFLLVSLVIRPIHKARFEEQNKES